MKLKYFAILLFCISTSLQAQNVIIVSAVGGDFSDPVTALEAIGSSLPVASASNRYVVKVLPGRYTVDRPIVMHPYVDLEGSGTKITLIKGEVSWQYGGGTTGVQGIINAASRSEIRHLTVRNTWADSSAIGIGMFNTRGSMITDVRSVSRGNATNSASWKYGVRIVNSTNIRLDRVTARGTSPDFTSCQGLVIRNSTVSVNNSRMVGAGPGCSISLGVAADDGSIVNINNSTIRAKGSTNGISAASSSDSSSSVGGTVMRIRHSVLNGVLSIFISPSSLPEAATLYISHSQVFQVPDLVQSLGTLKCFSNHDEKLGPLGVGCLP